MASMHIHLALIVLSALSSTGGCKMAALWLNDLHHTHIEQATTPRIDKRFRVLDAETNKPVAAARLVVVHNFDWMGDWVMRGTTDAEGITTIRLAKRYLHLVHAHVAADGYLMRDELYF